MDELTRERYGPSIPYWELWPTPPPRPQPVWPVTHEQAIRHRLGLCGTADLSEQIPGGDQRKPRRLVEAIRRWRDGQT